MTIERHDADHASVTDSSGNIFADLDLPHSEEDMLKYQIARAIGSIIGRKNLTQVDAARIIGVDQAKVSNILRGRVHGFSVSRLFRFLLLLGQDVDIHISQKRRPKNEPGRIRVRLSPASLADFGRLGANEPEPSVRFYPRGQCNVYIEARPKGRPHGDPIHDYVVEDHADQELASFATQREAIAWARNHGHAPLVARVRHLNDKKQPDHWRLVS